MSPDAGRTTSRGKATQPLSTHSPPFLAAPRLDCTGSRSLPQARAIVDAWRELIRSAPPPPAPRASAHACDPPQRIPSRNRARAGAPTLVACSGGADSSALLLALAGATKDLVVAHVVHDLRGIDEAEADRDSVRSLAAALGLEFAEARVSVRSRAGNAEAVARRLRYAALASMAVERSLGFVATAHHARDQLESVLMAVMRGSGPAGLAAIRSSRWLTAAPSLPGPVPPVRLIRPCLAVDPDDLRRICAACAWPWREDATNADGPGAGARAALRARVIPAILQLRPAAQSRAAELASLMGEVHAALSARAHQLLGPLDNQTVGFVLARYRLRRVPSAVLGEAIRAAFDRLNPGSPGRDNLRYSTIASITRAIRSSSGETRSFRVGASRRGSNSRPPSPGIEIRVSPDAVVLRAAD